MTPQYNYEVLCEYRNVHNRGVEWIRIQASDIHEACEKAKAVVKQRNRAYRVLIKAYRLLEDEPS